MNTSLTMPFNALHFGYLQGFFLVTVTAQFGPMLNCAGKFVRQSKLNVSLIAPMKRAFGI